ncbi:amidohydrolase family protein [Kribbella sp. NPDC050124]|uniref:amidohydrolase family protein n=1 Tax=Kribbella sp. NPDC050124 TaxID=3364114 RepID=UPI0037BD0BF1
MPADSRTIVADWVVPVSSPPLREGAVVIVADRIAWVGHRTALPAPWTGLPVEELAGVVTPGLVNAHCHLQYTAFAEVGMQSYMSFEEWSESFGVAYGGVRDGSFWRESSRAGVRQALATGTTAMADIVTSQEASGVLFEGGLAGVEFLEVIGQTEQRWRDSGRACFLAWLDDAAPGPRGISPHAPYSVDGGVISDLVAIAAEREMRIHSHLAESSVEATHYQHGDRTVVQVWGERSGEFALVRTGGSGRRTAEYAASTGLLGASTHVAHGIYLDRAEREMLLANRTAVALCPRSNAIVGDGPAPVAAYLSEGHEISVGTDSLSSSPSLDLMADVKALARIARDQGYAHPDLNRRLIRAATLGGARALGLCNRGALEAGASADLAVFEVEVGREGVETALVNTAEGQCTRTVISGRVVHERAAVPRF